MFGTVYNVIRYFIFWFVIHKYNCLAPPMPPFVTRTPGWCGTTIWHSRASRHQQRHTELPCECQSSHTAGQRQWQVLRVHPEGRDQCQRGTWCAGQWDASQGKYKNWAVFYILPNFLCWKACFMIPQSHITFCTSLSFKSPTQLQLYLTVNKNIIENRIKLSFQITFAKPAPPTVMSD